LIDFFNQKSEIKNPKSCLNGLFVQALTMQCDKKFLADGGSSRV